MATKQASAVPPSGRILSPARSSIFVRWQWPEPIWFDLLVSIAFGMFFTFLVLGPRAFDPKNISWLSADPATYYIGASLFLQDPHLYWPITFTDRIGYPIGESFSLMDPIPLLGVVLKAFAPWLPNPFQYLGIAVALACVLHFFFSLRLFRFLLGRQALAVLLPSVFLLISPPLTQRFLGHYALTNHWLLIAALYLLFRAVGTQGLSARQFTVSMACLAAGSLTINPYLAVQVLAVLTCAFTSLLWQKRLSWIGAGGAVATVGAACLVVASAFGFLSQASSKGAPGFRHHSMNLLAPIDPYTYGSVLLPRLPQFTSGQYEGYGYLGLGALALSLLLLFSLRKLPKFDQTRAMRYLPLMVCCLVFTLIAASTRISLGSWLLVDLDPRERLSPLFAPIRASGRMVWVPYYAALVSLFVAAYRVWRPPIATLLIALALALQLADTTPIRRWVRAELDKPHPTPLTSTIWRNLGAIHRNLIVVPAYQCGPLTAPGGLDSYRIFGYIAVAQNMRINSYYAARYSDASLDYHCGQTIMDVAQKPLSPESVYVVQPAIAALIDAGPSGPGKCHTVDGFMVCSAATDFGLGNDGRGSLPEIGSSNELIVHDNANIDNFLLSGWYHEPGAKYFWSTGRGLLAFRISAEQSAVFRHATLHLRALVGREALNYSLVSIDSAAPARFEGARAPRMIEFDAQVLLRQSNDQVFFIITKNPPRPVDLGINDDPRRIGVGLAGVTLRP